MTSPSSLVAKLSGVNSVIGPVRPMASKKLRTPSLPRLGPYHGADSIAASVDQSTSSERASFPASISRSDSETSGRARSGLTA